MWIFIVSNVAMQLNEGLEKTTQLSSCPNHSHPPRCLLKVWNDS